MINYSDFKKPNLILMEAQFFYFIYRWQREWERANSAKRKLKTSNLSRK